MIKHDGHLRTQRKYKTEYQMQASVFYKISRVFPKVRSVLSQCNTRLRLLHLLYRGNVKNNKTRLFCVLYSDKTWVFDQSERAPGDIYIVNIYVYIQTRKSKIDQTEKGIHVLFCPIFPKVLAN